MTIADKALSTTTKPLEDVVADVAKDVIQESAKAGDGAADVMTAGADARGEPEVKTLEDAAAAVTAQAATAQAAPAPAHQVAAPFLKGYEDLRSYGKGNVDALLASGAIAARAAEDLGREVAAYGQSSLEKSLATSKAMMGARSLKEVVEIQNDFARSSVQAFIEETARLQQLSLKLAADAFALLGPRMNVPMNAADEKLAATPAVRP